MDDVFKEWMRVKLASLNAHISTMRNFIQFLRLSYEENGGWWKIVEDRIDRLKKKLKKRKWRAMHLRILVFRNEFLQFYEIFW